MATPPFILPKPINDEQKDLISRRAGAAAIKAIEMQNFSESDGQRIIARGDEFEATIIEAINQLSVELPDPHCYSFTAADWEKFYPSVTGVKPLEFPLSDALLNSPCPFHNGKMVCETHFAFLGVDSVTMTELRKLNPAAVATRHSTQEFAAKTTLASRWYLLLRDIVPGSERKLFSEQEEMLPKEYEVPSAVAETVKDALIYKKTGVLVNPAVFARTADHDSDGLRVRVGCCRIGGALVKFGNDGRRGSLIGIGASLKLDQHPAA